MDHTASLIPTLLRSQLIALGIPEDKHHSSELAGLFPFELNVPATRMSAEELARVLIYFVQRKLISPPGRDDQATAPVVPGWHSCRFYRDDRELLDSVAPYFAEGLKNREGCLWVMPASIDTASARDALSRHVDDVDGYIASGQMEMLQHPQWYLDESGDLKTFEQISSALLGRQDLALARGYKFLRAAGDTGWVSGTEESKSFIDYEMKINAAIGSTKVGAMCTYRAGVTAEELIAIVNAHQDALHDGCC